MLPCSDPGMLTTCTWSIRLALGCPTLRSGTWLSNTSTWYLVGTWVPNTCSSQPRCTYHSTSLDELHTGCDTMWHLLFIRSGGYMWCTMDISYCVYMIRLNCVYISSTLIHYTPCSSTWRLSSTYIVPVGREFIGTPVDPDFSMLHSTSTSSLRYLSAPHYLSWRYSIIC